MECRGTTQCHVDDVDTVMRESLIVLKYMHVRMRNEGIRAACCRSVCTFVSCIKLLLMMSLLLLCIFTHNGAKYPS